MFAKRIIAAVLSGAILTQLVACGTILNPERKGQIDGNLDPAIVILDAVGLFFYLVPGVVAFAVDFSNGTIYLPGGKRADISSDNNQVQMVYLGDDVDNPAVVAKTVSEVTGQFVSADQIKHQNKNSSVVALLK